jgi:hypothetical protein
MTRTINDDEITGQDPITSHEAGTVQERRTESTGVEPHNPGTGRENEELEWGRRHIKDDEHPGGTAPASKTQSKPAREVFRKTELHHMPPEEHAEEQKRLRQQMLERLNCRDKDISSIPPESDFRDFFCTLLERQDQLDEEMREQVAGLCQQMEQLEEQQDCRFDRLDNRLFAIEKERA